MTERDAEQKLIEAANRLLRKSGFTATGRKRGAVPPDQHRFERRLIRIPCGGQPRSRRR